MPKEEVTRLEAITHNTKQLLYESYLLSIMLFGSELWRLNAASLARLEKFHRQNCVRSMAGTNWFITWKHHISAFKLEQRFRSSRNQELHCLEGPALDGTLARTNARIETVLNINVGMSFHVFFPTPNSSTPPHES